MTSFLARALGAVAASALLVAGSAVQAQETVKIGFVGPYTGPFAVAGQSFKQGVDAWIALNGDRVGGKKVEVIYRDSASADPTLSKRLAEELVVKDKVQMLGGFYLTPEVAATAPVANQAKVPLFIVNAATPALMVTWSVTLEARCSRPSASTAPRRPSPTASAASWSASGSSTTNSSPP
jgi:branched-chain amino acid transport system substrate-binding protein